MATTRHWGGYFTALSPVPTPTSRIDSPLAGRQPSHRVTPSRLQRRPVDQIVEGRQPLIDCLDAVVRHVRRVCKPAVTVV